MRHKKSTRNFGRRPNQKKALMRGLCDQLLEHGRIETTLVKAKELRKYVEPLITLGKRGDLHARRQAAAYLYKPATVKKLFSELKEQFADRNGGYTRIMRTGERQGDAAPTAFIELVGKDDVRAKTPKKKAAKKASKKASAPKAKPAAKKKSAKAEAPAAAAAAAPASKAAAKPAKEGGKLAEMVTKYEAELNKVGYDKVDSDLLHAICKSLGPSLYNNDASKVAASDKKEVEQVKKSFIQGKLGFAEGDETDGVFDKGIEKIGKSNRNKYRAVLYYIMVVQNGKESLYI